MRRVRATLAALAVLVVCPSLASAHRYRLFEFRDLGVGAGPSIADGSRFLAVQETPDKAHIGDTERPFTSQEVTGLPRCDQGPFRAPISVAAVGGGKVLWSAPEGWCPAIRDIASGQMFTPAGLRGAPGRQLTGIGTTWLGFKDTIDAQTVLRGFVEWRTGLSPSTPHDPRFVGHDWLDDRRVVSDLNAPGLFRRMCEPLRRERVESSDYYWSSPTMEPFEYDRPWGLTIRRIGRAIEEEVLLERCGAAKARVVGHCRYGCEQLQLGGGWATWRVRRRIALLDLSTGRRRVFTPHNPSRGEVRVSHTRRVLYASVQQHSGRWHRYNMRLTYDR
jgi:hypothetical protein